METAALLMTVIVLLLVHLLVQAYKDMRAFGVYGAILQTLPTFD